MSAASEANEARALPRTHGATAAVRAGLVSDPAHGAVVPPLYLSSNFEFEGLGRPRPYDYTRSGNPTRDQLADALAQLEGAASATVTASGMAAVAVVLQAVPQGAVVVAAHDVYGGTWRLLDAWGRAGRFRLRWVDVRNPAAVDAALGEAAGERAALLWLETPSNPCMRLSDIAALSAKARRVGARTVVDNTFLSPVLQRPIEHGADVVVHSTTKYLNGHSDVVGGAICCADPEVGAELAWWANATGATGAPFDAFLTLRGLRTLSARMQVHEQNARALSTLLAEHPAVAELHDPGRSDHPDHALALRQQEGFGGMLSFRLHGGREAVQRLVESLRWFTLAESLGGVESLVCHPATMTHAAMSESARRGAGIGEGLVRLSVGIEDRRDLLRDLQIALDRAWGPAQDPPAERRSADSRAGVAARPD